MLPQESISVSLFKISYRPPANEIRFYAVSHIINTYIYVANTCSTKSLPTEILITTTTKGYGMYTSAWLPKQHAVTDTIK